MQIILIGKNYINKIVLPQNITGTYWITDKVEGREQKMISIEAKEETWCLNNNSRYFKVFESHQIGINNQWIKKEDEIILKEYDIYGIKIEDSSEMYILFCLPVFEKYMHFNIKNTTEILIGSELGNTIVYKNPLVSSCHAKIHYDGEKWLLENYNQNYNVFVNGKVRHKYAKTLRNGDVVFIMGLKIILMDQSLYVTNPRNQCTFDLKYLDLVKEHRMELQAGRKNDEIEIEDYFSKSPRLTNIIECEKVKIDSPPSGPDKDETPMILLLGTSLTMGAVMMISVIRAIDSYVTGTSNLKQMLFSLIPSVAMMISMMLFPVLMMRFDKKRKKRKEARRQEKYKKYLNNKREKINQIREKQKSILLANYLTAKECESIILNRDSRLWERQIDDYDFLSVRLGLGDVPLKIDLQYPEERFSVEDDNLVDILNNIVENSKNISQAPITVSLVEKNISALISKGYDDLDKYLKELMIQLITFHSPQDLKLVFLVQEDNLKKWDYVKMLPHVWDDQKEFRFFADNYEEMNDISKYLSEVLNNRLQMQNKNYESFAPYYLIITEYDKRIESLKVIEEILEANVNVGFSLLCIMDDLTQLPNECSTFIDIQKNKGIMFENKISSGSQKEFSFDTKSVFTFEKILQSVSNIPMKYFSNSSSALPNNYSFLEMFDVGRIEQLNIVERWSKNDSTVSLRAPIGIDRYGMPIVLDIHENAHGPHGLIAGSTGSGKSEFIITYILSLAINYHPEDVNFILIDYKGGSLAGAFQKRRSKLPHLVGTITNIDKGELQRSLVSIQSELKRRQIIFNQARELTDEGTIDIYKYQRLYHNGIVKTPIAHLIIICDEFAELKQQQPEFMDELMSVSRIGRSLGVHLILATQKPAGIVNDQIRSNSKFAICLKVQDRVDSIDVIKRPDAASLKKAGQFYMQVGYDEYFILGQSAWSGAPYFPSDVLEKNIDKSVEFLINTGLTFYEIEDEKSQVVTRQGEQLTNIVKYLYKVAENIEIKTTNLWKESIPEDIYIEELKEKYRFKRIKNEIQPVIGEYDDPSNQHQDIIKLDISNNVVIYGNAESGKETLVSTMIYDLITTYTTQDVQLYIFDFGSEALKIFRNAAHVGDVVFLNDSEKITRFFSLIQQEITQRKKVLSNYNGDYKLYLESTNEVMPMLVIIINNFEGFMETYEDKFEEQLLTLTRECVKYRITFVITASSYNGLRYRLTQNLNQKIALQLNKSDDYFSIFENIGKKKISNIFGRGFISIDREIYEFQTAKICEAGEYNTVIKQDIEKINEMNLLQAKSIAVLPEKLKFSDVKEYLKDLSRVPIGIVKKDLKIYEYDFSSRLINLIISKNINDAAQFVVNILSAIVDLKDLEIKVLDAEKLISSKKIDFSKAFEIMISELSVKKNKKFICTIIGIDKFINNYIGSEEEFFEKLKIIEAAENCNIIVIETDSRIKNYEYSNWYKYYVSKDNGIWVGNGVDNQYALSIMDMRGLVNKCGRSFGYVIKQGNANMIKLLEMKEEENGNE